MMDVNVSYDLPGIEVSNLSRLSDDLQPSGNEIRLFHFQSLMDDDSEDDVDDGCDSDDDERELTFVIEDIIEDLTSSSTVKKPDENNATSPTKKSKKVLETIDNLEKSLQDIEQDPLSSSSVVVKDPPALKRTSQSSLSLKKTVSRLKKAVVSRAKPQEKNTHMSTPTRKEQEHDEEDSIAAAPKQSLRSPMKSSLKQRQPTSSEKTRSWTRLKKALQFKKRRNNHKKKKGERALLLPKQQTNNNDDYSLPDASWKWKVLDHGNKESNNNNNNNNNLASDALLPEELNHPNNKKIRRHRFFRQLLQRSNGSSSQQQFEFGVDKTGSLSIEEEGEEDEYVFTNCDEELLDHLVTICDKTSSLELERGFSSLQERIRSRSFSRLEGSPTAATKDKYSSSSFLERSSTSSSGTKTDTTQNESIPSFASLEEFLTSVSDETNAASLEALLFEQELANLNSQELAALLDSELEKLMREGFK